MKMKEEEKIVCIKSYNFLLKNWGYVFVTCQGSGAVSRIGGGY